MKTIDVRFTEDMKNLLRSMVGKPLVKLRFAKPKPSFDIWMNVGIYSPDQILLLQNDLHVVDFFGAEDEEIPYFELFKVQEKDITSGYLHGVLQDIPIGKIVCEIHIVEENQRLYEHGRPTYDVYLVRGIVFILEDGSEVAFEKNMLFLEFIRLHFGHDLISQFHPTELDVWVDEDGKKVDLDITRSVVALK